MKLLFFVYYSPWVQIHYAKKAQGGTFSSSNKKTGKFTGFFGNDGVTGRRKSLWLWPSHCLPPYSALSARISLSAG